MKILFPAALLLGLGLSACTPPGQVTGNNRVSVGIAADDTASAETATKTVTPATDKAQEQVSWSITPGKGVTFTFMTRPGSDAVYITGYRVLEEKTTTVDGTTTIDYGPINKMDLYLTSGFNCSTRSALQSCSNSDTDIVPANGLPGKYGLYLEGGLGSLAQDTNASVSQLTKLEFIGTSSNGAPVSLTIDNVVSRGIRTGAP